MSTGPNPRGDKATAGRPVKRNANSLVTRQRLLDAATVLFAEQGYHRVSVRQIAARAKVHPALVNYHFSSKEKLLEEAVRNSTGEYMADRLQRLNDARKQAAGAPIDLEILLNIYLAPVLLSPRWEKSGYLEARLHTVFLSECPEIAEAVASRVFNSVNAVFVDELQRVLPHLDRTTIIWRLYSLIGSLMLFNTRPAPPGMPGLSEGKCDPVIGAEVMRQILPYAVGALRAPAPTVAA